VFEAWQLELVAEARRGVLGTIARDGCPQLVPVCYAFDGARFGIAIDEKPKRGTRLARLANIDRDPRVTLLIDRYDDAWLQLAWLRVEGRATVFERGEEQARMLAVLRLRYPQYREMALEERPLILVEPGRVVSWRWS
jgi:PPOX class probable F420-dependent enzyme